MAAQQIPYGADIRLTRWGRTVKAASPAFVKRWAITVRQDFKARIPEIQPKLRLLELPYDSATGLVPGSVCAHKISEDDWMYFAENRLITDVPWPTVQPTGKEALIPDDERYTTYAQVGSAHSRGLTHLTILSGPKPFASHVEHLLKCGNAYVPIRTSFDFDKLLSALVEWECLEIVDATPTPSKKYLALGAHTISFSLDEEPAAGSEFRLMFDYYLQCASETIKPAGP